MKKTSSTSANSARERPTLKTIAQLTGLAVTTVSRALNESPLIAKKTRDKVRRVADDIGYQPDRPAQQLRTGRTNAISLLLDPRERVLGFDSSLLRGLNTALKDTPYHLTITPSFAHGDQTQAIEFIVRNRLADGIVFSRTKPFDARVRLLLELDFPFVTHGRTDFHTPHPYVDFDNLEFAYSAAKLLIENGRRRLAIILPPSELTYSQHLRYGFMKAVREAGFVGEVLEGVTLDDDIGDMVRVLDHRLRQPDAPDGWLCATEFASLAVLSSCRSKGLAVNDHYGLVAKQYSNLLGSIEPGIPCTLEDLNNAGTLLAGIMLRRINGEPSSDLGIVVEPAPFYPEALICTPSIPHPLPPVI